VIEKNQKETWHHNLQQTHAESCRLDHSSRPTVRSSRIIRVTDCKFPEAKSSRRQSWPSTPGTSPSALISLQQQTWSLFRTGNRQKDRHSETASTSNNGRKNRACPTCMATSSGKTCRRSTSAAKHIKNLELRSHLYLHCGPHRNHRARLSSVMLQTSSTSLRGAYMTSIVEQNLCGSTTQVHCASRYPFQTRRTQAVGKSINSTLPSVSTQAASEPLAEFQSGASMEM
jgi:hypothetical protein